MQFTTLVSFLLATGPVLVFGTGTHVTGTVCDTITTSVDYKSAFASCAVPACLEIKPVSLQCGCTTIPTITVPLTACPTKCAGTSYVTAIVDCFPTSPPPSSSTSHSSSPSLTSSSTTTSKSSSHSSSPTLTSSSGPASTSSTTSSSKSPPPSSSTTPIVTTTPYTNTTKTKTETHIITLTTCPVSVTCTGQTVTYTSTEVCPTTTCTCVLPTVTVITTLIPGGAGETTITTTPRGNTPPSPTTSLRPTFSQAVAAGGVEVGMGALGAFALAMLGMI